jgi:DNA-binding transcriptional ArsR family regulator
MGYPEKLSADVYRAIADPTRRAILDKLVNGPMPVHMLAADFAQSRPAISKHLRILREAELVREQRDGRETYYSIDAAPLNDLEQWLAPYRHFWQRSLNNLKQHLEKQ